jgi:hypothetical protein
MRNHDPILGDLLEEYREIVRPARGRLRATLWFARQVVSLVRPWMWGCLLGLTLGGENLVGTAIAPLAEDTPLVMVSLLGVILTCWMFVGFSAARQRLRIRDAIIAGAVVATISMSLFGIANFIRVTMFLDVIKERADWIGLLARFQSSGATDLRAFVIAEYLRSTPLVTVVGGLIGAVAGGIGGMAGLAGRRARA